MANDLRYPASVSENIVRALRKVANGMDRDDLPKLEGEDVLVRSIGRAIIVVNIGMLRALADELEAGKPETDNDA